MTDDTPGRRRAFVNARIIDPASGTDATGGLLIGNGRILDRGAHVEAGSLPEGVAVTDCAGLVLAPGLVDMRVQFREPGAEHKETIASAGRAAAAGGFTAMVGLPNTDPVIDDVALVEFVARRAREMKGVKTYVYGALTRGLDGRTLTELGLLSEAGVRGFTDADRTIADARVLSRALTYGRAFDVLIVQHAIEPSLARDTVMNESAWATRLGLSGQPPHAEAIMLARDLRLVQATGGRYHAAHLSTAEALDLIRDAKARGLPVTCDTAPHYALMNELAVGQYRTFARVEPPLRAEPDREAVVAALADGTIDAIASDHAPHDQESKRRPFAQAEPGIVGLETALSLTLELVAQGSLTLLQAIERLSTAPARILRLDAGTLATGSPADLVLFDATCERVIDMDAFVGKSRNAPYDGRRSRGRVVETIVDGRTVHSARRELAGAD